MKNVSGEIVYHLIQRRGDVLEIYFLYHRNHEYSAYNEYYSLTKGWGNQFDQSCLTTDKEGLEGIRARHWNKDSLTIKVIYVDID